MSELAKTSIKFNVTMDDLAEYNVFYSLTSPTIRALRRNRIIIMVPLVFALSFLTANLVTHHLDLIFSILTACFSTAAFGVYLYFFYRYLYLPKIRKLARKLYSEDKNPGMVGEHTLEVDEQGFVERTAFRETRFSWGALTRIENTPGYTYLFVGAASAFIIPHKSIIEGDFPALLKQIQQHYKPEQTLTPTKS